MAFITCKDVAFAYDTGIAVEGLNFTVEPGDYLCIVGENGSGKSTLNKGLLRLKSPARGELLFDSGVSQNEIGYLPQQTSAQKDFPAGVMEVVLSGRQSSRGWRPFYSRADREIALDSLEKLGITELRNQCYRELSGGQQQRVLLARALCATKKVLLLDEPVAGLDPLATRELYELIRELSATGITIIMVSHNLESALQYATKILHLRKQQLFFGTPEEYRAADVSRGFLGGEHIA